MTIMNLLAQVTGSQERGIVYTCYEGHEMARKRYLAREIARLETKAFLSNTDRYTLSLRRAELEKH